LIITAPINNGEEKTVSVTQTNK